MYQRNHHINFVVQTVMWIRIRSDVDPHML